VCERERRPEKGRKSRKSPGVAKAYLVFTRVYLVFTRVYLDLTRVYLDLTRAYLDF